MIWVYAERIFVILWGIFVVWCVLFLLRLTLWNACYNFTEKLYRRIGGKDDTIHSSGKGE